MGKEKIMPYGECAEEFKIFEWEKVFAIRSHHKYSYCL